MTVMILLIATAVVGCGGVPATVFVHDEYNFSYVERVAIIPFENLSNNQGEGSRMTRLFIAELLSQNAFDVVEPGDVSQAMLNLSLSRTSRLTKEHIVALGQSLKVQALFLATVNESSEYRAGSISTNVITLVTRLVDTESGVTVWSATVTEGGRGFFRSLFGAGGKSRSAVARSCVRKTIGTLID